jgi:hypothetical protein
MAKSKERRTNLALAGLVADTLRKRVEEHGSITARQVGKVAWLVVSAVVTEDWQPPSIQETPPSARPLWRKYYCILDELERNGVNTDGITNPRALYVELARIKGMDIPDGHWPPSSRTKDALNQYMETGFLRELPTEFMPVKEAEEPPAPVASPSPPARRRWKEPELSPLYDAAQGLGRTWRALRYEVLKRSDGRCHLCGMGAEHGAVLTVDHIKPKSLYPDVADDPDNWQALCLVCNSGKSNLDTTDWR